MLIEVSTPTSVAELRALYRRTRAYFAAANSPAPAKPPDAEKSAGAPGPVAIAPPPAQPAPASHMFIALAHRPCSRFSGRATVDLVARHFGLRPEALAGAARLHRLVVARWIVMRICIEVGGYTATRAGRLLDRDHTTVLYGLRELDALLARDAALAAEVECVTRQCAQAGRSSAGRGGA